MDILGLIGFIISLFPLIAAVVIILWIYRIKQNSDEQVEQNKEVIALLKEIKDKA